MGSVSVVSAVPGFHPSWPTPIHSPGGREKGQRRRGLRRKRRDQMGRAWRIWASPFLKGRLTSQVWGRTPSLGRLPHIHTLLPHHLHAGGRELGWGAVGRRQDRGLVGRQHERTGRRRGRREAQVMGRRRGHGIRSWVQVGGEPVVLIVNTAQQASFRLPLDTKVYVTLQQVSLGG
ncbi:hypothetical protein ACOMHN_020892 [Nucella lapillus]